MAIDVSGATHKVLDAIAAEGVAATIPRSEMDVASSALQTITTARAASLQPLNTIASHTVVGAINKDVELLRNGHQSEKVCRSPLWHSDMPEPYSRSYDELCKVLKTLKIDFTVWLRWYDARLRGMPFTFQSEAKRILVPQEIDAQGIASVTRYITEVLETETVPLNRARAIFVGHGGTGKTSLIRALEGEPVELGDQDVTPGAELKEREWRLLHDASVGTHEHVPVGTDITIHFWDFGGQVMVHHTHQFFLRANCIYVIVLDARRTESATDQARYWLEHVRAFGGDSPTLIVGNKIDEAPINIDLDSLQRIFRNVHGFYPLSALSKVRLDPKQCAYFEAFKHGFNQEIGRALADRQVRFKKTKFELVKELQRRSRQGPFLKRTDYEWLCASHGLVAEAESERREMLELFDQLGIIIHFLDLRSLDDFLLNPEWLTRGVYSIMYSDLAKERRGRISFDDAVTILTRTNVKDQLGQNLQYGRQETAFILEAMERFQVCYSPPHKRHEIIIPALLGEVSPKHNFDMTRAWAFRLRFEGFMPPHVLPMLFVDRREEIHEEEIWQFGVRLKPQQYQAEALIEGNFLDRTITIYVIGADARDYLGVLRDRIMKAIDRMKHLRWHEEVELTQDMRISKGAAGEPIWLAESVWADYKQILSHLDEREPRFVAPGGAIYNLSRLETRLPRNDEIARVLNAFDVIERDITVLKNAPEIVAELHTLRRAVLGKDLTDSNVRKEARSVLKTVFDRVKGPLEILGKVKGASEGTGIIIDLLRRLGRVLGMMS